MFGQIELIDRVLEHFRSDRVWNPAGYEFVLSEGAHLQLLLVRVEAHREGDIRLLIGEFVFDTRDLVPHRVWNVQAVALVQRVAVLLSYSGKEGILIGVDTADITDTRLSIVLMISWIWIELLVVFG